MSSYSYVKSINNENWLMPYVLLSKLEWLKTANKPINKVIIP